MDVWLKQQFAEVGVMRFPHVAWAAAKRGLPHYQLAAQISLSEARLSRGLSGRIEFKPDERAAIARVLGFSEEWLFQEVSPPQDLARAGAASLEAAS
jgi:ribosome-binding protein aMBF1 (putative translation factor)